ncbi:MAG: iron ABC transporter permease [Eubacteriales bacterium]|nr:iron ABC transporter permease [Eubacteriales bacterium]
MKVQARKVGNFLKKPHNIILLVLLVCLAYLVVVPLIYILKDTMIVHTSEVNRVHQEAGTLTSYHWAKTFSAGEVYSTFLVPLFNSLLCAVFSCIIAIVAGGLFAWLVIRTDMHCKKLCSTLFMFLYIMPGWTLAIAWTNFFKNSLVGGTTGIFEAITGISTPNWFAYGFFPIVLVTGLHYAPYAYILIGGILKNMDSNLEEAAQILKTSRFRIFIKVTLPLVKPAVLSTVLLVFASGLSVFSTAQFLGLPVKFYTLATKMYSYLNGTNPGRGYVYAVIMLVLSFSILYLNQRMLGTRKSYTTVSGKSSNISLTKLRGGRKIISAAVVIFVMAVTLLPFLSFATESLTQVKGDYSLANFTLRYWIAEDAGIGFSGILRNPTFWKALKNTLLLAVCCSVGAGTVGCLAGYGIARKWGTKLASCVNSLTFLPYLIPSIAISAIYLSMFSVRHGIIPALYGSSAMLVLIGVVKYLPMASRSGLNSMFQISATLEESALIMGVPWHKRMCRILVPIQKTSIMSGYLLPFISCTREMELFVLLYTPSSVLLTTLLFMYNQKGYEQFANAITLLIVIIVISLNTIINKLTGASIDSGIGG